LLGLIVAADERSSIIVSDRGEKEVRRFLKSRRIRPTRSAFIWPELCHLNRGRVAFYQLRGDPHFLARRDLKHRISLGGLAQAVAGCRSLASLLFEPTPKILGVPGVPSKAFEGNTGRGVL
jgi:hypothetical protein